jgi:hypothetical protein
MITIAVVEKIFLQNVATADKDNAADYHQHHH